LRGRGTRFRHDNGTETDDGVPSSGGGATWIAAIDSHITMPINFGRFRFRFCCTNEGGSEAARSHQLRMSYDGGAYNVMSTITPGLTVVDSPHIPTNRADSTDYGSAEDLYTAVWANATNGCVVDATTNTGLCDYPTPVRRMEIEYSLQLGVPPDVAVGVVLSLQGGSTANAFLDGYDFTPELTIGPAVAHPEPWFIHRNRAVLSRIVTR
jgi:hypothetical protein